VIHKANLHDTKKAAWSAERTAASAETLIEISHIEENQSKKSASSYSETDFVCKLCHSIE